MYWLQVFEYPEYSCLLRKTAPPLLWSRHISVPYFMACPVQCDVFRLTWGCRAQGEIHCKSTLGFLDLYQSNTCLQLTQCIHRGWHQLYQHAHLVNHVLHQHKTFPSRKDGSFRVDPLRQGRQRHPGGRSLHVQRQCHVCHVAYCPPITVSPVLLALSVCSFKPTLWRCSELWPYVRIHSLGTGLHRDCNAMWRCENLSSHSFYIKLVVWRKVRRWDTTRPWASAQLRGSTKSRKEGVRPKVRKDRVCIFVVWQDEMKMRCCLSSPESPEYILQVAHSTSITLESPYTHRRFLKIYLDSAIELVWRCTWKPWSSELRDALGAHDRSSYEMHWEAVIVPIWRCNWRLRLSELRDALGGRDRASLGMHLEAEMQWTQRCALRLWPIEFGDALTAYDRARLEEYLKVVDLEGGATAAETLFIG